MVEVEDNVHLLQKVPRMHFWIQYPDPAVGHRRPTPLPETPGHSRASLTQCLSGSLLLAPGSWFAQGSVCPPQESVSSVLYQFWRLCGGVNSDLLREGLCHTQVCCTCLNQCPLKTGQVQIRVQLRPCPTPAGLSSR